MYTRETIEDALEALELGFTVRETAELVGVTRRSVRNWAHGILPKSYAGRIFRRSTFRPKEDAMDERELYTPPKTGPLKDLNPDQIENILLRAVLADLKVEGWDPALISNRNKCALGERLRKATGLPLHLITSFLKISKSSYEYQRTRIEKPTKEQARRGVIQQEVKQAFVKDGNSARGYRFVTHTVSIMLKRPISEKIVRDVMRTLGLSPCYIKRKRHYSSYEGELDEAPKNLPLKDNGKHDFPSNKPNKKWVSDISEFRLPDDTRKVYLSPVIDLFDGKPIGWATGLSPTSDLANSSLKKACKHLKEGDTPFCHTDRGCHYRWKGWKDICKKHGITRSMSRKGTSPDNACAEGFFGRLKNEFFYGRDWRGVKAEEFIQRLNEWIAWYSTGRLKQFHENGHIVWDTIDGRRKRLGLSL